MGRSAKPSGTRVHRIRGFSMVELVVSVAIVLIMGAIALPSLTRSYRIYQLNDSATRLAGILKLTRFEAIRRNTLVDCRILKVGANWVVWVDPDRNGVADANEAQFVITGTTTLMPAGAVPLPAAITAALGGAGLVVPGGTITYDARGAVNLGGAAPPVYVLYLGSPNNPDFGYRAVVLLPSGVTQVWTASGSGWQRIT